jgi:hypothetical protein
MEGKMSAGTLLRLSGLAGIVAGCLIIISEILAMFVGLMDMATMAKTPLSPTWVPLNLLQLFGVILLLLALVGLYARQAAAAGGLGLIAFLVAFLGTAMFVGTGWSNAFTPPVVARANPNLLMGFPPSPLGEAVLYTAVLFALGLVLFGITVIRAGVLPRTGGWLLVAGGVLSRLMPMLYHRTDIYLPLDSWVTSLGLILLGYALWTDRTGVPIETPVYAPGTRPS